MAATGDFKLRLADVPMARARLKSGRDGGRSILLDKHIAEKGNVILIAEDG